MSKLSQYKENIEKYETRLGELQKIQASIVENQKREDELEHEKDFYKLQISSEDIDDINILNKTAKTLHTPEILYKLIYKTYYEKPYNDLIGRVLSNRKDICGIYKITNLKNNKAYVGQSVNVAERWKQHIKRGCGAETTTRNKLYPAMFEEGIWNFTFELLEECDKKDLDSREDFYQQFYKVIEYGYSIK